MSSSRLGQKSVIFSKRAIERNIKRGENEQYLRERSRADDHIVWRDLDYEVADILYDMHTRSNAVAKQCREYMLGFIGTEMSFNQTDEPIYPKGNFEKIVSTEWAKFIADAYDWIFITGICPVEFTRSSIDEIEFIPSVLDYFSVRIQIAYIIEINDFIFRILRPSQRFLSVEESTTLDTDHSGRQYRDTFSGMSATYMDHFDIFQNNSTLKKSGHAFINRKFGSAGDSLYNREVPYGWVLDKCAIVLHDFGNNPDMFGRLKTPLQSILDLKDLTSIHAAVMTANQMQSAAHPMFIQNTEQPDLQSLRDQISFESVANKQKDASKQQEEERLRALSVLSANYYGEMQDFFMNTIEGVNGEMKRRISSTSTLAHLFTGNRLPPVQVIPLPTGYMLPSGQKRDVTLGQRFFDLEDMLRWDICSAYGIPRDLLQNSGTHSQNTAVQAEFLLKTIMKWSDVFKRLLTFLYNSIYGKTDSHYRITTILERRRISTDMAKRIEQDIVDEWNESGGITTRRQIEEKGGEYIVEEASEEESEEEEKPKSSNKRQREEPAQKDGKKQRPHAFDYDIQSKVNSNVGEKEVIKGQPLENIDEDKPVEVTLALKAASSIDLLTFEYMQGAITDEEYWINMRQQIGFSVDDKSLKKLKAMKKEREALEQKAASSSMAKPGASGKSGKSAGKSKKKTAEKTSSQDGGMEKSLKKLSKAVTGLLQDSLKDASGSGGVQEGRGRKKDEHKAHKEKISTSHTKAKESNVKRATSAHRKQTTNAKSGSKNKEKKGK